LSASTSPREMLATFLAPLLPSGWRITTNEKPLDGIHGTVLQLNQRRIIRTPGAPLGAHDIEFVVTVSMPYNADYQAAEDALDDGISALLFALDDLAGGIWSEADKTIDSQTNRLTYQITLTVTVSKEN
jgi:hypothetical protein